MAKCRPKCPHLIVHGSSFSITRLALGAFSSLQPWRRAHAVASRVSYDFDARRDLLDRLRSLLRGTRATKCRLRSAHLLAGLPP